METFAYIHVAVNHEDPSPAPELDLALPNSAWMGIVGTAAVVAVMSGNPEKAAAATGAIGYGSSGAEVQSVQKTLGIEADGQYGPKTATAVTDFQVRAGLKQIDGVVGQETATAMGLDENYKPTGYVDTASGAGLNVRSGPGLDYSRIAGAPNGAYLDEVQEDVVYADGYAWRPLYGESDRWVATNYTVGNDPDYYYDFPASERDVSYNSGVYYNGDYYEQPVSYHGDYDHGGYVDTRSNIGLNVRSGPGLGYSVIGGASEGSYVPTAEGVVYQDGYAWTPAEGGGWVASNYLD